MERILRKVRRYLPQIAFCMAALWLFYQIYPIIFAQHDDLRNYTLVRRGTVFSDAWICAKTGRISHLWNHPLLAVPFLLNKVWFYKLVQFSALLFDLWAGWRMIKTHLDRQLAGLAAVLTVSFACITAYHNLLIAYAFCHQIALGFCLLGIHYFLCGQKAPCRRNTLLSCIFLLISVMIYEAFAAMLLLYLAAALTNPRSAEKTPLHRLRGILPQVCTVLCYCVIYFGWQMIFPTAYDGLSLTFREPFLSLYALGKFSAASFPLSELMRLAKESPLTVQDAAGLLLHPMPWITAALSAAAFYQALPRIRLRGQALRRVLLLTGLGVLLPCLLISVSAKYLDWMRRGAEGYLPSFYSFCFLAVFLILAAAALRQTAPTKRRRKLLRGILTGIVFCITLSASIVNAHWRPHFAALSLRYRNFDQAVSEILPDCTAPAQLYAPDHEGIHGLADFTEDYLKIYTDTPVSFVHEKSDLLPGLPVLCIRAPEDYAFTLTAVTDSSLQTDTLIFRTLVPQAFQVTVCDTDGNAVTFENVRNGDRLTLPEGKIYNPAVRPIYEPAKNAN